MPDPNTPTNSITKIITLSNMETYTTHVEQKGIDITYAEYQQLTPAEKQGKTFYIIDYDSDQSADASEISYDNTVSGLQADDVQDAIDELKELVDQGGTDTTYTLSVGTGTDANKIVLTPSTGTADKITVPYASDAGTVNGKTVAENVPSGAVFTDTTDAASLTYSNTTSGLSATKVQNAIDELSSEKKDEYTTITYDQWQQLTPTQQAEKDYYISDYPTSPVAAGNISYSNTSSGMTADDVQGAVDELASEKKDEYTTITYQQWQALTPAQQSAKDYYISDYPSSAITAGNVSYSNTTSGMSANNVQGAVDELKSGLTNLNSAVTVLNDRQIVIRLVTSDTIDQATTATLPSGYDCARAVITGYTAKRTNTLWYANDGQVEAGAWGDTIYVKPKSAANLGCPVDIVLSKFYYDA